MKKWNKLVKNNKTRTDSLYTYNSQTSWSMYKRQFKAAAHINGWSKEDVSTTRSS